MGQIWTYELNSLEGYKMSQILTHKLPQQRGALVHKTSLALLLLVEWCRHGIEPCALTCFLKQSNLSAWHLKITSVFICRLTLNDL